MGVKISAILTKDICGWGWGSRLDAHWVSKDAEGGGCGRAEMGTICPFGVFPQFYSTFWPNFGGNPCSEASCGVVTFSLVLKAFQVVLGSWNPEFTIYPSRARKWPFQAPKTLRFKGKMANFEAKNTLKQGRNAKRTNGTHFTRVRGGALLLLCERLNLILVQALHGKVCNSTLGWFVCGNFFPDPLAVQGKVL